MYHFYLNLIGNTAPIMLKGLIEKTFEMKKVREKYNDILYNLTHILSYLTVKQIVYFKAKPNV